MSLQSAGVLDESSAARRRSLSRNSGTTFEPRGRTRSRSQARSRSADSRSPRPRSSRSRSRSYSAYSRSSSYSSRTRSRSYSRSDSRSFRSYSRSRSRSWSRSRSRSASPTRKLVVERLTKNVVQAHILEIFSEYGKIVEVDMPLNRRFGVNRGLCYVTYEKVADAEVAIDSMHEGHLDGSMIKVFPVLRQRRSYSRSVSRSPDNRWRDRRSPAYMSSKTRGYRNARPGQNRARGRSSSRQFRYRRDSRSRSWSSRSRSPVRARSGSRSRRALRY